jgi:hypothetical protein
MKQRKNRDLVLAASIALILLGASVTPVLAQTGFPNVIAALRATPGCLGVETAQTERWTRRSVGETEARPDPRRPAGLVVSTVYRN